VLTAVQYFDPVNDGIGVKVGRSGDGRCMTGLPLKAEVWAANVLCRRSARRL